MAERFRGRIIIGGNVSEGTVKQILTEADSIEEKPSFKDILEGNMQYLEMEDEQLAMGEFGDVEQFLEREGIPYVRYSDGCGDYPAECAMFRPDQGYNQSFSEQVTEDGFLDGVTVEEIKDIRQALHQGNIEQADALLKKLLPVEMPALPPLSLH